MCVSVLGIPVFSLAVHSSNKPAFFVLLFRLSFLAVLSRQCLDQMMILARVKIGCLYREWSW